MSSAEKILNVELERRNNMEKNKTGYIPSNELNESKITNAVSVSEQETNILFMRDQDFAEIYTSDTTQMTRLDKLCASSPEYYQLISDTGRGKTYRIADKSLISLRSKKKEMSEEQRNAARERMREYQATKRS